MGKRGGFLAAAVLAAAMNVGFSIPAAAAGTAPRAAAPQAAKNVLPPVMKGGKGNNNPSQPSTKQSVTSAASSIAAGTPTPNEHWTTQNPNPDANPIFAITCPTTLECIAVGLDGIQRSIDGGATWTTTTSTGGNLLFAVSCANSSQCVAVGSSESVFTTSDAGLDWTSSSVANGPTLFGVSCLMGSLNCEVVGQGGSIFAVGNGAGTGPQTSPVTGDLFAISCSAVWLCAAVGASGEIVTYDGTSWTARSSGTTDPLFGVSCPTTAICEAVGANGRVVNTIAYPIGWAAATATTSGVSLSAVSCQTSCYIAGTDGAVYVRPANSSLNSTEHGTATPNGALFGISCPALATCFAAGENGIVVTTTDGATGWTQQTGAVPQALHSASCPSTSVCYAVGNAGAIETTTNGGSTWTQQTSNTSNSFNSISCPSTTTCFAVADSGQVDSTTTSGGTWTPQTLATNQRLLSVSCSDATHCGAIDVGGDFFVTTDGTSWSAPNQFDSDVSIATGISCPDANTCYATINSLAAAHPQVWKGTFSGTWSWAKSFDMALDPDSGFQANMTVQAINCASTTVCKAVGTQGMILATSDGGTNWRSDTPPEILNFTGVSCASASTCFVSADDRTVGTTSNAGATWTIQYTGQPGMNAYNNVACASATMCLAVGDAGVVATTSNGGAAWSQVRPLGFGRILDRMSCYNAANCYTVGLTDILFTHDSGAHWTDHTLGTTETLVAISCPGANTCYAVGWPGAIDKTTDGGTTWVAQPNTFTGADRTLIGVSCADATHCVAVGTDGIAMSTSDGSTWGQEATPSTTNPLFGVSCPTTAHCVAIAGGGAIYTRNGGTWTAVSSGTTQSLRDVSCVNASTCYIAGGAGTILVSTNGGASWMAQTSGTTSDLDGIHCAQPGFCVAGGSFGTALVTVDGATWNPLNPLTTNTIHAVAFPDLNHVYLAGNGGMILADNSIFPSCRSVAIAPNMTSPQPVGTMVTLNATSSGCPDANPLYRFWIRDTGGTWHIVQDFSTSASFGWDTSSYAPGTYLIGVWVKDANSSFTYDAYAFGTFTIQVPPCTFVTVASDVGSPQNVGTTVHFTATPGGCPMPLYQWWVRDTAGNWNIAVPFGTGTNTFTWNTTGLTEGTYQIGIWVKEAHSSASYEAFAFLTFTLTVAGGHCTVPGLVPAPTSPQIVGTPVTFTASAQTCLSPLFRFYIRDLGGTWHVVQDFSSTNTFAWNGSSGVPNTAAGTYLVGIWAKATGSANTYDDFFFLTYTLTPSTSPPCAVSIVAAPGSGQPPNTPVTWLATPTNACTASPKFRFWVNPPGGTWTIKQDYSINATFMWTTPNVPGTYQVGVWILQTGSTNSYDNFAFTTFSVLASAPPTPCTDVEVGTSPASPQLANSGNITLTATAHGCPSPQYRWWVRDLNANWSIVQDYPGSNTFMWNTNVAAGTYLLGVWVRNTGSTASYEAYSFITFTLTPNPPPQVCTSVNVAPDLASPQPPGTTIHFTATANGCNNPQYEFFVEPPGGSFAVAQPWGSSNTFVWNTSGLSPGPWAIGVWARQNGSSATYESFAFITYQLSQ